MLSIQSTRNVGKYCGRPKGSLTWLIYDTMKEVVLRTRDWNFWWIIEFSNRNFYSKWILILSILCRDAIFEVFSYTSFQSNRYEVRGEDFIFHSISKTDVAFLKFLIRSWVNITSKNLLNKTWHDIFLIQIQQ